MYLKNSAGRKDGTWTLAVIGFTVTSICILLSLINNLQVGDIALSVRVPDTALMLGYLTSSLAAYTYRRTSSDKLEAVSLDAQETSSPGVLKG